MDEPPLTATTTSTTISPPAGVGEGEEWVEGIRITWVKQISQTLGGVINVTISPAIYVHLTVHMQVVQLQNNSFVGR